MDIRAAQIRSLRDIRPDWSKWFLINGIPLDVPVKEVRQNTGRADLFTVATRETRSFFAVEVVVNGLRDLDEGREEGKRE